MATEWTISGKNALYLLRRKTRTCPLLSGGGMSTKNPLLLISPAPLDIGMCDGKETVLDAQRDIFIPKTAFDIVHHDIDELFDDPYNAPTRAAHAHVFELKQNAMFAQMFKQLHKNPRKLCFTENQIVEFVRTHGEWLRVNDFCSTFFPFSFAKGKVGILVVVFAAEVSKEQFAFYSYKIWSRCEWSVNFTRRLVVKAPPYR